MFVKQIDMAKALELAAKGMEIKVLAPIGQEGRATPPGRRLEPFMGNPDGDQTPGNGRHAVEGGG